MTGATLVYDDDCGFCTWWAGFFDDRTDLRIVGFSELDPSLRARLPDGYETCSHLVTDGGVYSCGESVEQALVRTDLGAAARPAVEFLRGVDAYRDVREWGYRQVADNRVLGGRLLSKRPPARGRSEGRDGR